MRFREDDLNGIYKDIYQNMGKEIAEKFHQLYKGQQITFPMRFYSRNYVIRYISTYYDGKNLKEISKKLQYSEKWLRTIIENNNLKVGED